MNEHQVTEDFLRLYTANEGRLRAYVLSLVPRWSDAEEIVQRCSMVLWKKFSQFKPGTNFFAWACQIARLEVKEFRKQHTRERVVFSDDFVEAVADEAVAMQSELPPRIRALQRCVEKLSSQNRELLRMRYDEGKNVQAIARSVNRPLDAVYKALSRIRLALHNCIDRALAVGEV
jgi:RNA polymerase sigma-70 factor, ECF subfamily